jgi:hypothetical protein
MADQAEMMAVNRAVEALADDPALARDSESRHAVGAENEIPDISEYSGGEAGFFQIWSTRAKKVLAGAAGSISAGSGTSSGRSSARATRLPARSWRAQARSRRPLPPLRGNSRESLSGSAWPRCTP